MFIQIWEFSSAGSEHLPYKQGVTGSNPVIPTPLKALQTEVCEAFCFCLSILNVSSFGWHKTYYAAKSYAFTIQMIEVL